MFSNIWKYASNKEWVVSSPAKSSKPPDKSIIFVSLLILDLC